MYYDDSSNLTLRQIFLWSIVYQLCRFLIEFYNQWMFWGLKNAVMLDG